MSTYKDAGVDIEAGNELVSRISPLAKKTKRPGADSDLGGFGGLFDLAACGYNDPVLVAANDGVGTKLMLAFELNKHDTVGIDLVAMCVNDLIVQGAEPLFFLDYFATGGLDTAVATDVIAGISQGCIQAGCALIGGETAEMPGMYQRDHYDLAGFSVGAVERNAILPKQGISQGDVILGLASSGVHSNGFSLVRHVMKKVNATLADSITLSNGATSALGDLLIEPTRIYVKQVLSYLQSYAGIKGLAHITGGGFTENIPRVLPKGLGATINLSTVAIPDIFSWIKNSGDISDDEMLRTFNCGIGMIMIVSPEDAQKILSNHSDDVILLGSITPDDRSCVTYEGKLQWPTLS